MEPTRAMDHGETGVRHKASARENAPNLEAAEIFGNTLQIDVTVTRSPTWFHLARKMANTRTQTHQRTTLEKQKLLKFFFDLGLSIFWSKYLILSCDHRDPPPPLQDIFTQKPLSLFSPRPSELIYFKPELLYHSPPAGAKNGMK
jgi:hypothetical protein